jgi:hypothetical protein
MNGTRIIGHRWSVAVVAAVVIIVATYCYDERLQNSVDSKTVSRPTLFASFDASILTYLILLQLTSV